MMISLIREEYLYDSSESDRERIYRLRHVMEREKYIRSKAKASGNVANRLSDSAAESPTFRGHGTLCARVFKFISITSAIYRC